MRNITTFLSEEDFIVHTHLSSEELSSPLQSILKGKYGKIFKNIKTTGIFLSLLGASIFLINESNNAIKRSEIGYDSYMETYIMNAKKDYMEKYQPSKNEIRIARNEYNEWEKSNLSNGHKLNLTKQFKLESFSNYNKKQFLFSLKSLKKPHSMNEKYHNFKYSNKSINYQDIVKLSLPYGINPDIIYGVMLKESKGDRNAESGKHAKGAFQFLENTAREFSLSDRTNSLASADTAIRYLLFLNKRLNGNNADINDANNLQYSLAAYNAGYTNVKGQNQNKIPNFKETIKYVSDILGFVKGTKHYIRQGENINKIARQYNISELTLYRSNLYELTDNNDLKWGKFLNIENLNSEELQFQIKKGNNLKTISKLSGVSVKDIMEYNSKELNNKNLLKIGKTIKIPPISKTTPVNVAKNIKSIKS